MNHTAHKKPFIIRLLLITCLCLSPLSYADNKADVQVIGKKVEQLSRAMIDADGKVLKQLSSPLLSYGHSGGHIEDQNAFIEKIVSGKSDFVTIEVADQTISISGDVVLVRHNLNADIKDGGVPNKIHLGILLVWQKQAGEWKLLARQAFKYPPQVQ